MILKTMILKIISMGLGLALLIGYVFLCIWIANIVHNFVDKRVTGEVFPILVGLFAGLFVWFLPFVLLG